MKSFFKFVFTLLLVAIAAAVVASIVSKKKLEAMTDDEIREYLSIKLSGKVGDEQLTTIQDAVITGVRGGRVETDHYVDDVEEVLDELEHVAEEAHEDAEEAIEGVEGAGGEAAEASEGADDEPAE